MAYGTDKPKTKIKHQQSTTNNLFPNPAPYTQTGYWQNWWNNLPRMTITSDPTDRGLPDYLTYSPQSTFAFPVPAYTGGGVMNPGMRGGWNYAQPTQSVVPAYGQPTSTAPTSSGGVINPGSRAGWSGTYAGNTVLGDDDGYNGMPQNYWWMSDEEKAATNEFWAGMTDQYGWTPEQQAAYIATYYGENGAPRPGDPYQVYPYWKHDKDNVYGLAGRGGKVTQLQYGKSQPDWVRKLKPNPLKPTDTNKTYDNSLLDNLPTTPGGNLPAWAGDLVSWRT